MIEYRDIKGYEGLYQVSNTGIVRSLGNGGSNVSKERILKQQTSRGYKMVALSKNSKKCLKAVHVLVAEAFINNPDNKPTVNHIDHNRENNNVDNLNWSTYSEQCDNDWKYKQSNRDFSYCEAMVVCVETGNLYRSQTEAHKETGINQSNISACCRGIRNTAGGFHWKYAN